MHEKAKLMVVGRKNIHYKQLLELSQNKKTWLFHCASLGEYEMALPIALKISERTANSLVLFTFYSPSGYNHARLPEGNFAKSYLPWDTLKDVSKFLNSINPVSVVIMRYEFWLSLLTEVNQRNIPLYILGAAFRETQFIWRPWGKPWKSEISKAKYIGVIDSSMTSIASNKGLTNAFTFGDSKFNRAILRAENFKNHPTSNPTDPSLQAVWPWIKTKNTLVLGSSWPLEEKMTKSAIENDALKPHFSAIGDWQLVIAPHDISPFHCRQILLQYQEFSPELLSSILTTNSWNEPTIPPNCRCLIIDSIGQLATAYSAAKIAIIGGGFGKGLHNITEPLAFGVPVLFGPNFKKFPEASNAISAEVAHSFQSELDLATVLSDWMSNQNRQEILSKKAIEFTKKHQARIEEFVKLTEISISN